MQPVGTKYFTLDGGSGFNHFNQEENKENEIFGANMLNEVSRTARASTQVSGKKGTSLQSASTVKRGAAADRNDTRKTGKFTARNESTRISERVLQVQ